MDIDQLVQTSTRNREIEDEIQDIIDDMDIAMGRMVLLTEDLMSE